MFMGFVVGAVRTRIPASASRPIFSVTAQQTPPRRSSKAQVRMSNGLGTERARMDCSLFFITVLSCFDFCRPLHCDRRTNNTGLTAKVSEKLFDFFLRLFFFRSVANGDLPAARELAEKFGSLKLVRHGEGNTMVA